MRIVFMGTPDFAAACLERMYDDGHDVAAVFTQPDRPRSRGMRVSEGPVKALALQQGTPVYQPATLVGGQAADLLRELDPELIAVVAYGRLLPREILDLPRLGCINIHGSLLPKYRGAAPVQHAILNGETHTGVTSMYLSEGMDEGDMILKKETAIGPEETAGELLRRLAGLGAQLLSDTVAAIAAGHAPRTPQDDAEATYAPPLTRDMSPIDWGQTGHQILCRVRGLNPWPAATAEIGGVTLKIYKAAATVKHAGAPAGTVVSCTEGIEVACAGGTVTLLEVQAPGGRRMAASDYLRGHPICL